MIRSTLHTSHSDFQHSKMNQPAFHSIVLTLTFFSQKSSGSEFIENPGLTQAQAMNRSSTENAVQGDCFSDKGPCRLSPRFSKYLIHKIFYKIDGPLGERGDDDDDDDDECHIWHP